MVKGFEIVDGDVLDVGAVADGGFAVVVPLEGGGGHALQQHPERTVLARLELVAHHAELAFQIFLGDVGIDHAVGFQVERPFQVFVRGRESLEVVGAVVPGGTVGPRTMFG